MELQKIYVWRDWRKEGVAKSGRVEVAGCLEMNDFEINFLDTQADEGWNWHFRVARGGEGRHE